ncbi:MAG: RHS repeat-associated core domain-containing protein [Verrucomicrobiae bacterium]|nr:RHS repeat-associated core domain-containing protein [Verrucomicrobiae bacterium]
MVGVPPSTLSCAYDFENRLTHATTANGKTVRIWYDGDGNRVKKTVTTPTNSVTTFYVVDDLNPTGYAQVLEEHVSLDTGPSTLDRVYSYGHTLISQRRLAGSQWIASFYGYDGHNNVRYLTDQNGNITDTFDYDAFGNLISRTGDTPNNYLYCGEQFDPDLGMYFLRARYLNPDTGRFWTMDVYEGKSTDPISLHKYLYAAANPVNQIDPTGRFTITEKHIAAGIIAILATANIWHYGFKSDPVKRTWADIFVWKTGLWLWAHLNVESAQTIRSENGPENALLHVYTSYCFAQWFGKQYAIEGMQLRETGTGPNTLMDMQNNQTGVDLSDQKGDIVDILINANLVWLDERGRMVHGRYPDPEAIRKAFGREEKQKKK